MEMVLTGSMMDAKQAESCGLVCRVVPDDMLIAEATKLAEKISSFSRPVVAMAKETVNASYEMTLEVEKKTHFSWQ
jgi:enoyl-CoA hydratase